MKSIGCWILGLLLVSSILTACSDGKKSAAGFRLPDGDEERGKETFLRYQCNDCHRVQGLDLPAGDFNPPVVLGGEFPFQRTDGDLVTSIANPSHRIARGYRRDEVTRGGKSRMTDFNDTLTIQEIADLVAFLHTRYRVVPSTTHGY